MTRTLILIAGVGFGLAVFCFVLMTAIGGTARHFTWNNTWRFHRGSLTVGHDYTPDADGGGPTETRELAWSGASGLDVDLPADVVFTQAPGPGKLVITGPKGTVDQLEVSGSNVEFRDEPSDAQRVKIVMTAPDVRRFSLGGDETLSIADFSQDDLDLDVSGSGKITAQGKTKSVKLDLSGDGDGDLGKLTTSEARVEISGSGRAAIAPSDTADINISGDGEVDLVSRPANVRSDVSGSGRIVQGQSTVR
jgi:hypothetical protein